MTPAHQEDSSARVSSEQRRQLEHPDRGGQGLEEAVDDDHQLADLATSHQLGHAVPRLSQGELEGGRNRLFNKIEVYQSIILHQDCIRHQG